MLTRRSALAALSGLPFALQAAPSKKKVAAIITEYRRNAHADVIVTRMLEGYEYYGKRREPAVQIVSMYTDQVPKNDMSRDKAAKHGVPIAKTVREALVKDGKLAVDGVVLIGEHGDYPTNEKGQKMYPRHELFSRIVEVFRETGKSVPVFTDKHLSYDWTKAKQMYDWSKDLNFPLMAGSSLPVAWRKPEIELPLGVEIPKAVVGFYGGKEVYGFHGLETLQSMVERRKGGETGVRSVQCLEGDQVWKWTDQNPWAAKLLDAAVARSETGKPGPMRELAKDPAVFLVQYQDGLEAAVYYLDGKISDFVFACEVKGKPEPVSTLFWLQNGRPYAHFAGFTYHIERFLETGKPQYPVERTLLTTGILAAAMDSCYEKGKKLETPHLDIDYRPVKQSLFNRGAVPKMEDPSR